MKRFGIARWSIVAVALAWQAVTADADMNVVIHPESIEPAVLRTTTGTRIEFENRTGRAVHLEFEGDPRLHEVVQAPATGPFWVTFNHPGQHRYVVHVYEPKERTLRGVVEVSQGTDQGGAPGACSVAVLGTCVQP